MTAAEIVAAVKELSLPDDSFVVFGSCPMALAGLREAGDIDLLVSEAVYADLQNRGWKVLVKGDKDRPVTHGPFEAHSSWAFSSHNPSLAQLLETATVVSGVPFASLAHVKKWKQSSGRPKDLVDIQMIDAYLVANN